MGEFLTIYNYIKRTVLDWLPYQKYIPYPDSSDMIKDIEINNRLCN